mgnify:CR=1 FL=1
MYELVKTNQRCRKERNTYENKTHNKGFNYRSAFGAIYLVLLTVLSSVLTIVPILFLATR